MLHERVDSIALMNHWTPEQEAENLARLFKGVSQAKFAREFNVPGGASMVSQHIKGRRPINMDAALAYKKGFGLPLAMISPRLAEQMDKALRELDEEMSAPEPAPPHPVAVALGILSELLSRAPPERRDVIAGLLSGMAKDPSNPVYVATLTGLLDGPQAGKQSTIAKRAAQHRAFIHPTGEVGLVGSVSEFGQLEEKPEPRKTERKR